MFIDPATLAPQDNTPAAAAVRREIKLVLVIEGPRGTRKYGTDADAAWTQCNDAYDHAAAEFESTDHNDSAYYILKVEGE